MPRTRPTSKTAVVIVVAVLLLAGWYIFKPRPDLTLIGKDVKAYRLTGETSATGHAGIDLDFTRASDRYGMLNVAVDLNADGKFSDYATVGGAIQPEWIVKNVPIKVDPGTRTFHFAIADPDIVGRNNFKLVAVLTKGPLEAWTGNVPGASAAASVFLPSITP